MKKITLGSSVVVSDPCYELGTWCQAVIKNVLPGTYYTDVETSDQRNWGLRISELIVLHEDHFNKTPFTQTNYNIGVDSGQCGVFDLETYRNDFYSKSLGIKPYFDVKDDGDEFYNRMCTLTLSEDSWGTYEKGVVSSSGFGDGSYNLFILEYDNKIVGFRIVFIDNDELEEEYLDDEDDELEDEYLDDEDF